MLALKSAYLCENPAMTIKEIGQFVRMARLAKIGPGGHPFTQKEAADYCKIELRVYTFIENGEVHEEDGRPKAGLDKYNRVALAFQIPLAISLPFPKPEK